MIQNSPQSFHVCTVRTHDTYKHIKVGAVRIGKKISYGDDTLTIPTFGDNIKFFFNYQLGHMYFRYFMWNFAGRQNGIQGNGELSYGNWISGIPLIDNIMLGNQSELPSDLKNNKARNKYYLFPLPTRIIRSFMAKQKKE